MGDFIPAPTEQQYQTDDQFYAKGGGFDNFGADTDAINTELDSLLGNAPAHQGGEGGQGGQGGDNGEQFKSFIEETRRQRELDRQQFENRQQQEAADRRQREIELERERIKLEAENKAKSFRPQFEQIALTEEQKKVYADADPYITAIVNERLSQIWDNNITPALAEHQQKIMDLAQRPTEVSLSVEQQVALSRPNVNSIVAEPEFARYLAESVEGLGMTRRDIMSYAYQKNDVSTVLTILDSYTASKDKHRPQRSVTPTGGVHSAPQGGRGGQPRMRGVSELDNAQAKFRQGQITREKLTEIENHFETLAQQGLIDYNK